MAVRPHVGFGAVVSRVSDGCGEMQPGVRAGTGGGTEKCQEGGTAQSAIVEEGRTEEGEGSESRGGGVSVAQAYRGDYVANYPYS